VGAEGGTGDAGEGGVGEEGGGEAGGVLGGCWDYQEKRQDYRMKIH